MDYIPALKNKYKDEIIPALKKDFGYKSVMQVPRLEKIVRGQQTENRCQEYPA